MSTRAKGLNNYEYYTAMQNHVLEEYFTPQENACNL